MQARTAPIKELLLVSGLSPGLTSLSGVPCAPRWACYCTANCTVLIQKDSMLERGMDLCLLSGASVEALGSKGLADMLWALACLGGVPYFQEEMDAVLQVSNNPLCIPLRLLGMYMVQITMSNIVVSRLWTFVDKILQ